MSDDERKISFDTGINLDGLENDTKELKSMANDIARTIENMGKSVVFFNALWVRKETLWYARFANK